jgi:hypothetical protein
MDTKITLTFRESEMKWIETMMTKYYGFKPKNKKELKSRLGMFISTMFSKGMYALEEDNEYMEVA